MQRSNHALAHLGGECANDDEYAFTPSGIRTKVALKATPEGIVVPLAASIARLALHELAVADDLHEEEPTTEWLERRPNLRSWDEANGSVPVSPPALPPNNPSKGAVPRPVSVIELDPLDFEQVGDDTEWSLATWLMVGAAVLGAELVAMVAALV